MERKLLDLKLQDKDTMPRNQEKSKGNWYHNIHTETKVEMGPSYSKSEGQ